MIVKKTFRIDMYSHYRIHVIITDNFEEAIKKHLRKFTMDMDLNNLGGVFIYNDNNPWEGWILLPPNASTSTIAHESFHATARVMHDIGSKLDGESEEPYAYLLGYITNQVVIALLAYDKKYPAVEGLEKDANIDNN